MRVRFSGWGLALGVVGGSGLTVGCAGAAVDSPTDTGGTGGSGPTGESGGSGAVPSGYTELCAATGGNELTFADEAEATDKLAGSWVLCSGPGLVFATEQPRQAGVELTTDMHWYALEPSEGGLTRASGFQASDTWRFQPPQDLEFGPANTAMLFMGIDYSFVTVSMLDSPRKSRWDFGPLSGGPSVYAFIEP